MSKHFVMLIYCQILLLFIIINCECSVNEKYYPTYHFAPPYGWMNDPNGFCIFNDEYHLFYQFNPNSSLSPGIAHWGHAKSPDLFHWEHLPIAMYPDKSYDKNGVFSGSAIIENNTMFLIYTGNVNKDDRNVSETQELAVSTDGVTIRKYEGNPIIKGAGYQPNFRDPKVWKHANLYYAIVGNSYDNIGRVILYSSKDLVHWEERSVIDESDGSLGYMWECPDFFEIDGLYVLLFSPQGVKPEGFDYQNLYQTGYKVGNFNYETVKFTPLKEFKELDHGHDFYATQTLLDSKGNRILIAWQDMWEQNYPEGLDGWSGQMTIPRTLSLNHDLDLIQRPVPQIELLRDKKLHSEKANSDTIISLTDRSAEIRITADSGDNENFQILFLSENNSKVIEILHNYEQNTISLNRGGKDGVRTAKCKPVKGISDYVIYVDRSSVELFYENGEITFSSRYFYDGALSVTVGKDNRALDFTIFSLKRSLPKP